MIKPDEFDKKIHELREISKRMKELAPTVSMVEVMSDYSRATRIYEELEHTILEIQEIKGDQW